VKLPRDLSGQDVVKTLKKLGFNVEHQKGSHIRLAKDGLRVTVPNHKEISAPKTLQTILKQAGVTVDQFRAKL
jgi:predicted RNA binding protein YcfA (HicA-like mRNA interferase family)